MFHFSSTGTQKQQSSLHDFLHATKPLYKNLNLIITPFQD